jgi:hypothetical protein
MPPPASRIACATRSRRALKDSARSGPMARL